MQFKSTADLLVMYFNWRSRHIVPRPRRVHQSAALRANPLLNGPTFTQAFEHIIQNLYDGRDVTPHLSRLIKEGYAPRASGSLARRFDLDLLLNDWNVHHLHLSAEMEPDGFVRRTGPVLIGVFDWDDAYLIDILPDHRSWTREHIAHVMIDEWPDSGFVHHLKSVVGVDRKHSDQDRALLRGAGIQSGVVERNGRFYMIGRGGLTTAGTSSQSTRRVQFVLSSLRLFVRHLLLNPNYVPDEIASHRRRVPDQPRLRLRFFRNDLLAIEEIHSGVLFPLPGT